LKAGAEKAINAFRVNSVDS
jgi:hypothetical protein